jgi:FKBP-type peptidyl-prolyl cis-trans isomerase
LWIVLLASSFLLSACYSTQSNTALEFPETANEISQNPQLDQDAGTVSSDIDLNGQTPKPANQDPLAVQQNINTQKDAPMQQPSQENTLPQSIPEFQVLTAKSGTGATVESGNTVTAKYKGQLLNGKVFDQGTFSFAVGTGQVIQGWDQGFIGLQEGGQYRLLIPAAMAYGERGAGAAIPPNADLVFDVEVVKVEK